MKEKNEIGKRKACRPETITKETTDISFADIKKYTLNSNMRYGIGKQEILRGAEQNDAPENVVNLLRELPDNKFYYFIYEIRDEINTIINKKQERQETELDVITKRLNSQTEICGIEDSRIKRLEKGMLLRAKALYFILYSTINITCYAAYFHMAVCIASNGKYTLMTAIENRFSPGWVLSSPQTEILVVIVISIAVITFVVSIILWIIQWED